MTAPDELRAKIAQARATGFYVGSFAISECGEDVAVATWDGETYTYVMSEVQ